MTRRRKRKPNTWDDHYARQARKEKQPARSVYKLQEIQKKYRLMKKGDRVLDLGDVQEIYNAGQAGTSLGAIPEPGLSILAGLAGLALIFRRRK